MGRSRYPSAFERSLYSLGHLSIGVRDDYARRNMCPSACGSLSSGDHEGWNMCLSESKRSRWVMCSSACRDLYTGWNMPINVQEISI